MAKKRVIENVERELRFTKIRRSGNITEVRKYESLPSEFPIIKLSKEDYMIKSTGEVKAYKLSENRSESLGELSASMDRLRSILNANFNGNDNEIWVTLTYRENMKDQKRLYHDREKFWKKILYNYPDIPLQYISIAEPQQRGAWHMHEVWKRTDDKPLYIMQRELLKIWGHGGMFVKRLNQSETRIGWVLLKSLQTYLSVW